jgi:hypothetical protein
LSDTADSLRPAWQAYANARGLAYYDHWFLPQVTQLLHHGSFDSAPNLIMGDLPGDLANSWLAHFVSEDDHSYTAVVVRAAASVRFVVRVLCHDRGLARSDAANPDAERELVPMDDRQVQIESDAFLRRYELLTDHDQDEVRAWQLFDPALVGWLTDEAPEDFSFELQDGALCCFVPGAVAEAERLDALCEATARVHRRVLVLGTAPAAGPAAPGAQPGTREDEVERALAAHPFERAPRSVRAAARHFGAVPLFSSGSSRRLGAEAFFRAHAVALGLERIEPNQFLADHIDLTVPGAVTQVARGRLPGTGVDGYLVFTTDTPNIAWTVVLADIAAGDNGFAFTTLPEWKAGLEDGLDISSNGAVIMVWKPGGTPSSRTAKQLREFCDVACPLLERAVTAAKR